MGPRDPGVRLPLPDDLPADTVAALRHLPADTVAALRDLADAVENRYAATPTG